MKIDINCDLGEWYGKRDLSLEKAIMPYISSCNIACGFHSGDPLTIEKTIAMALEYGVKIGAHPSYPDFQGFGRRNMSLSKAELIACVRYQVAALKGMVEALGGKLHHVKPHGALFNHAAKDKTSAEAIGEAISSIDKSLIWYGLSGSPIEAIAKNYGLTFWHEVFADRRYEDNLSLRSRDLEGAVLKDTKMVTEQVRRFVHENQVITYGGQRKTILADTICIHSDTAGAVELAAAIFKAIP
jgi:5-oxoprolinase (ATP-hydrolysing) subunit A